SVNQKVTDSDNLLPDEAMSNQAAQISDEQFPNDNGLPLLLVWQRDGGLTDADYESIQQIYEDVADDPLTGQSFVPPLYQAPPEALQESASDDGAALTTPIFFEKDTATDTLKEAFQRLKGNINEEMDAKPFSEDTSSER